MVVIELGIFVHVSLLFSVLSISFHCQGSVLYNYFTNGKLERSEGTSITEGIGNDPVTVIVYCIT